MGIRSLNLWRTMTGRTAAADEPSAVPDGCRVYAIGDVHGRLDLLTRLVAIIREDDAARVPADTTFVLLGDLVDRGPDSRGVLDFLIDLERSGAACVFIGGNHDEVFARAAAGDREAVSVLHRMGGEATAVSYGISAEEYAGGSYDDLAALFRSRVPAEHLAFLRRLREWHRIGDYLFVHAGIRPGRPMHDQVTGDLRWIRSPFLDHRQSHGAIVVHGHTVTDAPDVQPNRIGIDTGAYRSDRLTALGLFGTDRWFLTS